MPRFLALSFTTALVTILVSNTLQLVVAAEPAKPVAITLVPADEKDLAALIAKNKGKVVFVDYCATFCGPCTKAFPNTVDLPEKAKEEDPGVVYGESDEHSKTEKEQ